MQTNTTAKTQKTQRGESESRPDVDKKATGGKATAKKPAAKVSQAKRLPPPKVLAEVHLIPMDRIVVEDQVRTEFDMDSIKELAEDIEARGLRSPVEVTPIGDEKYKLTLGGRRHKAFELKKWPAIPALIVKTNDRERLVDQLAENIQREDLTLKDQAFAVRRIFDELGSVVAVMARVKKSKPWVSKRLSITTPDLHGRVRNLLEGGKCDDLELLGVLNQIWKQATYHDADSATYAVENGQMNRDQARDFLRDAKAKARAANEADKDAAAKRKANNERLQKEAEEQRRLATEGTGPEFIEWVMRDIERLTERPEERDQARLFLDALKQEQREALLAHLDNLAGTAKEMSFQKLARSFHWRSELCYTEQMAMIMGVKGRKIDNLYAFVDLLEAANLGG